MSIRPLLAAIVALGLAGCAQTPPGHSAHHPGAPAAASGQAMPMARMDEHMKAMRSMHERMARAKTPEERNALMAEHHKLMQEGMAMMGGMGGGMGGMMGHMQGPGGEPAARQQTMEKRMEMMQSMMQMMMDRLPPVPAKP